MFLYNIYYGVYYYLHGVLLRIAKEKVIVKSIL